MTDSIKTLLRENVIRGMSDPQSEIGSMMENNGGNIPMTYIGVLTGLPPRDASALVEEMEDMFSCPSPDACVVTAREQHCPSRDPGLYRKLYKRRELLVRNAGFMSTNLRHFFQDDGSLRKAEMASPRPPARVMATPKDATTPKNTATPKKTTTPESTSDITLAERVRVLEQTVQVLKAREEDAKKTGTSKLRWADEAVLSD